MADRMKKYEKYALDIKGMMIAASLWPGPVSSRSLRYLTCIYMTLNAFESVAMINFMVHNLKNMAIVTKVFGTLVSTFGVVVKVSSYVMYRAELVKMHENLETTFRNDIADPESRTAMLSSLNYFYRPTMVLSRASISIPFIYCCSPIISIIIQYVRGVSPIKYRLPFLTQFPWDHLASTEIFLCHYAFDLVCGFGAGFISASTDAAFGFYIFQMATQFRTLSYRMRNLKATDNYRAVIKECLVRYELLTKCRDTLEHIYGPIILYLMVTSAMSLCANIYQTSKMNSDDNIVVAMVYIIAKLLQALLYASFGLFLTTETENFRDAVYNSGWPGSGEIALMTSVLILLMQKPLVLSACNFSTISLDMFVAIVNTALSYYFLLKTIEESK